MLSQSGQEAPERELCQLWGRMHVRFFDIPGNERVWSSKVTRLDTSTSTQEFGLGLLTPHLLKLSFVSAWYITSKRAYVPCYLVRLTVSGALSVLRRQFDMFLNRSCGVSSDSRQPHFQTAIFINR